MAPLAAETSAASSRIAILSSHLLARQGEQGQPLTPRTTDARVEERPTPGGGKGKLHVTDERTGKQYDLEIKDGGVVAATDFKKVRIASLFCVVS